MLSTVDYNGEEALKSCHSEFHRIIRRNPFIEDAARRAASSYLSSLKPPFFVSFENTFQSYIAMMHLPIESIVLFFEEKNGIRFAQIK